MPVTTVVSEWREHSPIVWTSDFQGKAFEVRGTLVRLEPERLLEYDDSNVDHETYELAVVASDVRIPSPPQISERIPRFRRVARAGGAIVVRADTKV
jgi:hypothetical protein